MSDRESMPDLLAALQASVDAARGRAVRCDECGLFRRASEVHEVWGSWPNVGPDHEACEICRPELRPEESS